MRRTACSRSRGIGLSSARSTLGRGMMRAGEDMIEVRLLTRSGCSAATICAIMPPIEAPTTWAAPIPSASISPTASRAMSLSVYGGRNGRRRTARASIAPVLSLPAAGIRLDRPTSRLS